MDIKREFVYTKQDFQCVQRLIHDYAGISLNESKNELVYNRLAKRLRQHKLVYFSDYLALLQESTHPEWQGFINALTTNLTAFFREQHHFTYLTKYLHAHFAQVSEQRPVKIWCAASSSGEEAYSIAMSAAESYQRISPPVKILATDLDTEVLAVARKGIYYIENISRLTEDQRARFLLRGSGSKQGQVMIRKELRSLITFNQLNLLSTWPMQDKFDVIFCRNVLIYFDKETQYRVLEKFAQHLNSGGLLIVGHAESFPQAEHIFKLDRQTVYVRC